MDLRKVGLKITVPRTKILQILENATPRHMRPEDIYKRLVELGEEIGLATVYRVLTQFETAGIVTRHHFEGGYSLFELNDGDHHDHLVCLRCDSIEEFMDESIEARQGVIASKANFKITDHVLIIYGFCASCQEK